MPAYLYTERKKSWLKQDYKLLNKALGISRIPFWGEAKLRLVQEKKVELIGHVMHIIWHLNIADKACGKSDIIFFMRRPHRGFRRGQHYPTGWRSRPVTRGMQMLFTLPWPINYYCFSCQTLAVHSDNTDRLTVQLEIPHHFWEDSNTGFRQRSNPHISFLLHCGSTAAGGLLSVQANWLIYLTLGSRVGWNGGWHLKVCNRLMLRSMMPFIVVNHWGQG